MVKSGLALSTITSSTVMAAGVRPLTVEDEVSTYMAAPRRSLLVAQFKSVTFWLFTADTKAAPAVACALATATISAFVTELESVTPLRAL